MTCFLGISVFSIALSKIELKYCNEGESIINKKLYRAFSRQANGLTLNISVLQGLLRVNGRLKKMRKVDKLKIMNDKFESKKQRKS